MTRVSTASSREPPTGRTTFSWSTRRRPACIFCGHLADLVEEDGALGGVAEEALAVAVGAGEGAAHVAEELALQEVLGDGAAVDADEGLLPRAPALWMARATTSLPVPLSPVMSTGTSVVLEPIDERRRPGAWPRWCRPGPRSRSGRGSPRARSGDSRRVAWSWAVRWPSSSSSLARAASSSRLARESSSARRAFLPDQAARSRWRWPPDRRGAVRVGSSSAKLWAWRSRVSR